MKDSGIKKTLRDVLPLLSTLLTADLDQEKTGFSVVRFALMLCTIALAHFATAVTFGHSVPGALGSLAEDTVMLAVVDSVVAYVRSRMRRKVGS
ncbi:hypothetical protein AB0M11_37950 [Streptomyces sp. NPDC051987]|uniref:hypothetical protein n=1 Tax=Streptomyces sp. NPDC051987 TaxID=3155808 RepID=UPI0034141165